VSAPTTRYRPRFWARARKFGIALLGAGGQVLNQGLVPEPYARWVAIGLAIATAAGVYRAPNAPPVVAGR
jgi:hypothetical protein